jgi:IS1 family transposase
MWQELITLWQSVRDPEYLHLLIEPLPLYGLGIGLMCFVIAFVFGERRSRLLALGLIVLSCASVWPYNDLREKATARIIATRPPDYENVIRQQTQRRKDWAWPYYAMTVLTFIAVFTGHRPQGRFLLLAVVVGGALLFWISIWLHKKECEVYHRNIVRYTPPR